MKTTTILFDLDGTLLPMDQDTFVKTYFGPLSKKLAPLGYEADKLIPAIWKGTARMAKNDGSRTNEETFWDTFCSVFGEKARDDEPVFQDFYENDFIVAKTACGFNSKSKEVVSLAKRKGFTVALATNPIFPKIATESRIEWAGLCKEDFALYTTYEKSRHSKPNLDYYTDVITALGKQPEECVMVGNDVDEDMVAEKLGMKIFLLTDCLINKSGKDISNIPQGNFDDLIEFIEKL